MPTTLIERETAERVLARALARGGEFAEVFCEESSSHSARLDQRRVEELGSAHERGAGIRVVVGATTGFAHTADLSEASLLAAAEAASVVARSGTSRTVSLGEPSLHRGSHVVDPLGVDPGRKVRLLEQADQAARGHHGAIGQVQAVVADSGRRFVVANSDGVFAGDDRVRTRFSVQCVVTGDSGMQTGGYSLGETKGFELLDESSVASTTLEAAAMAVTKLQAVPAPSGDLPVVLAAGSGGILFHEACGHGLEADHVFKDASVYSGRLGQMVASELVTLVDDATMGTEWGAAAIDDEGHVAGPRVLIKDGILVDYMWDLLRARREGRGSPANGRRQSYADLPMVRMTNTYVLGGTESPEEIVAQTARGVFVAQLGGGQVNMATGDFVFGTRLAFLIEDGKITAPLRDCNLIGNGPEVLSRVDAVGNDFKMGSPGTCGKDGQSVPVGTGQSTLRVSAITVGGSAA
jgi:TldD protein